jgi:hypothetical protein
MNRITGLLVCLALALALSGCSKSEPAKTNPSPSPSSPPPSAPPSPPPSQPSNSGDDAAKAKAEAKPKVDPSDDHSDDPWYDDLAAAKLGAPGGKKPGAAASAWEPDKALLDQLEPYQDVEGYQIRLPKGYSLTQLPMATPAGMKLFFWMGPRQADGGASFVQVSLVALPSQETKLNLATALAGAQDALKAQQREWQQTPAEPGQINGLPSLRVQNRGAQGGAKVRGFMYAVQDGSTLIMISGAAPEANADALKLAEAAALTFRKK